MSLALWLLCIFLIVVGPRMCCCTCLLLIGFPGCYPESPHDAVEMFGEWIPIGQIWTHKRQGKVGHWWMVFSLCTSKWTSRQVIVYLYPLPQDWMIICPYSRSGNVLYHICSPAFPASVPVSFTSASLRLDYNRCDRSVFVIYLCSERKLKQCLNMVSIISVFSLCMLISISLFLFNLDLKLTTSINLSIKTHPRR